MNEFLRRVLMLPPQASTVAEDIDHLHYLVITTTFFGASAVALFTLIFIVRYRRGSGRGKDMAPDERRFHTAGGVSYWMEAVVVFGLLGTFVFFWVLGFRQYVQVQEPPRDTVDVYVVGKQWMWSFAYPNGGGSTGTLYVPVGKPVKLILTSRDVVHSFYVPAFRLKKDAVPGRSTTMWFEVDEPGRYEILCTEYCGLGHSTMRGELVALPGPDYEEQVEGLLDEGVAPPVFQDPAVIGESAPDEPLSMAQVGERIASERGCLRCHTVDGTPHIGPTWAGLYLSEIPLAEGGTAVANEAYLTESMMDPMAKVHAGFKPVMPSYQGRLTSAQAGALVEFIRSLQGVPTDRDWVPLPAPVEGEVPLVQPRAETESRGER